MTLKIYTDGSALGINGEGPAGYGILIIDNDVREEISVGYIKSTNNRMELLGVINALDPLVRGTNVEIYTDSQYVIKGITKWIHGWKRNNWKNSTGNNVKNKDLWMRLEEAAFNLDVKYIYVPAHTGIEENETADKLAKQGAFNPTLEDIIE